MSKKPADKQNTEKPISIPKMVSRSLSKTISGEHYKLVKQLLERFRMNRTDGVYDEAAIQELSQACQISGEEAWAILAGRVNTIDDAEKEAFHYTPNKGASCG